MADEPVVKTLDLHKQLTIGFWLACLILLFIGWRFYQNLGAVLESTRLRGHTHQVIETLSQFLSHIKDAETGQRGFIITGRTQYLVPYTLGTQAVKRDLASLGAHLRGNLAQEANLQALLPLVKVKLSELQQTIDLRHARGFIAAQNVVLTDRGQQAMEAIRRITHRIEVAEVRSLALHERGVANNTHNTLFIALAGSIFAIGLLSTIFWLLNREIRLRQATNETLQKEIQERIKAQEESRRNEERYRQTAETLGAFTTQLQAVNHELEAFSYSVSHDLRAPLRSIDGFSKIILGRYADLLDEDGTRYLHFMCENSQRMGHLIDDLLNLSRLSRSEMRCETVDLSAIAEAVLSELREQEPDRQVVFDIQPGVTVFADANLMRIGLQNLLSNAWKFTGHIDKPVIRFGREIIEGEPAYFVSDNGAGFDLQYADKLFGAFQRLHAMHEFPGTGIGLAIVQRVIHRHGGRVWAESELDRGAVFRFTLQAQPGSQTLNTEEVATCSTTA